MLIVCPACASEYEIPADRVGPTGRQVRCAACRETWFIAPDSDPAASALPVPATITSPAEPGEGAPSGMIDGAVIDQPTPYPQEKAAPTRRAPRAKTAKKGRGKKKSRTAEPGSASALLAAGLALVVMLPLVLFGRSTVVSALPQTAALYAGIGMPVNLRGIEIRDVAAFQNPAQGDKPGELVVEGDLVGIGKDRVEVPDLSVEVRDERGQTIYRWVVPSPRPGLEKAEQARFHASLSAPPTAGRSIALRFVSAGQTTTASNSNDAPKERVH